MARGNETRLGEPRTSQCFTKTRWTYLPWCCRPVEGGSAGVGGSPVEDSQFLPVYNVCGYIGTSDTHRGTSQLHCS